jgi:signal transduction histidine kinase
LPLVPTAVRALTDRLRRLDPVRVDIATAAVLLVVVDLQTFAARHEAHRVPMALFHVLLCFGIAVRRRWLLPVLCLATLGAAWWLIAWDSTPTGPSGFISSLIPVLLFYGGGAFLTGARSWTAFAIGIVLVVVVSIGSGQVVSNLVFDIPVFGALPFFVGRWSQERRAREQASRERAERLDAERELRVRAAALGERARLAREIHDVIAHSVSVMVIQAAGARTVMDGEPGRARDALESVERAGREALAEMRRLLGVLGDGEQLRALAPQPSFDDLEELMERTRAAGLPASVRVEGEPVTLAPGLSLCAYRVVQEALTNAIKHAGPASAEVSVRWAADALELEVADDGRGDAEPRLEPGGHGLVGMRERAALHGGTIEAGPGPTGGFAVRARIPLIAGGGA